MSHHPGNGCSGHVDNTVIYKKEIYNIKQITEYNNIIELIIFPLKATDLGTPGSVTGETGA